MSPCPISSPPSVSLQKERATSANSAAATDRKINGIGMHRPPSRTENTPRPNPTYAHHWVQSPGHSAPRGERTAGRCTTKSRTRRVFASIPRNLLVPWLSLVYRDSVDISSIPCRSAKTFAPVVSTCSTANQGSGRRELIGIEGLAQLPWTPSQVVQLELAIAGSRMDMGHPHKCVPPSLHAATQPSRSVFC